MKQGFGKKAAKTKAKKAKRERSKKQKLAALAAGGDVEMADDAAPSIVPDAVVDMPTADEVAGEEKTAKGRQAGRMQVKTALKLKMKSMKQSRAKLTKLPTAQAKQLRKGINSTLQDLKKEAALLGKKKSAPSAATAAPCTAEAVMAE